MKRTLVLAALALIAGHGRAAEVSLTTLRPHPRLLLTADDQARLERVAREDPLLAAMLGKLREAAEFVLTVPPASYKLEGPGPRRQLLLHQSQAALSRVMISGLAYRFFKDTRFADRARLELRTVAAFRDWHPGHFLDTAEMTAVVGIGYDWLHAILPEDEKTQFRQAIVKLGLEPSLRFYDPIRHWPTFANNWNQVCNAGIALGALAIADNEPDTAKKYLSYAVASAPRGLTSYAPDGAYPEGPMYWAYGTTFSCLMLAALDSALGTDFGLAQARGLDRTGLYMMQMIGPRGYFFNYADCHQDDGHGQSSAAMFWLGRKFNRPVYSSFRAGELGRRIANLDVRNLKVANKYFPLDIVWYDERGRTAPRTAMPVAALFRGTEAVTMRSAFDDPRAVYIGFKGGSNRANHSHLDLGSFVVDANGVRWAVDLGADDYDAEGYWDVKEGRRWTFYRLNTQSHNTLVIGGANQDPNATCPVVAYSPSAPHAIVDLSAAYAGHAGRVRRGIALLEGKRVLVQDEIERVKPGAPVRWAMVTPAEVTLRGNVAQLRLAGEELSAEILEPAGLKFEIVSTAAPTPQEKSNDGTRMLAAIAHPAADTALTLRILLTPAGVSDARPAARPLAAWKTDDLSSDR